MPNNPVRRDKTGAYWTVDETSNQWRPLSGVEHGQLRPTRVLNQMGVDFGERITLKWFARNPQQGIEMLRVKGYEVLPYGSGFNAAVRKPGEREWKLVDPNLFSSPGEFFRDMADLMMDAAGGAVTAAGIASGAAGGTLAFGLGAVPGAVAGGAASSAGFEAARQGVGSFLGIPDNIGAAEIAFQGVAGGVTPPITRGLGAVVRGAGAAAAKLTRGARRVTSEVTDFVLGGKERAGLDVTTILLERNAMRDATGRFLEIETPEKAVGVIRAFLDRARGSDDTIIGRLSGMRDSFVRDAENRGLTRGVNLRSGNMFRQVLNVESKTGAQATGGINLPEDPAIRELNRQVNMLLAGPPSRGTVETILRERLAARGIRITPAQFTRMAQEAFARSNQAFDRALETTKPTVAIEVLKRITSWTRSQSRPFADIATDVGAPMQTASRKAINQVKGISSELNRRIRQALGSRGNRYGRLQDEISLKMDAHGKMRALMGTRPTPSAGAEGHIINVLNEGKSDIRNAFRSFDAAFGIFDGRIVDGPEFMSMARRIGVGLFFTKGTKAAGAFGVPTLRPRFTAFAQPIGAGALIGTIGGTALFAGPAAAGGLAAGGLILSSPRVLTRLAPHAVRLGEKAASLASRLQMSKGDSFAVRALTAAAMQETARFGMERLGKGIAREKPRPRRMIDLTR